MTNSPSSPSDTSGRLLLTGIAHLGDLAILDRQALVAFFCSTHCPGRLILKTYDLACELRDAGVTVIGGFHTPMERECLTFLLKGAQPVIICPARGIEGMRLPPEWRDAVNSGRLLLLSAIPATERRVTATLAARRNAFVATIADQLLVPHATPGGKLESLCRGALASGKPLRTFDDPDNVNLVSFGAQFLYGHGMPCPC